MAHEELTKRERDVLRSVHNAWSRCAKPPTIRDLMQELGYQSPHSAALIVDRLIESGYLYRGGDGLRLRDELPEGAVSAQTIDVPIVGVAPCGSPLLAVENIETTIPVATRIAQPSHRHFFLRAEGDSMNLRGIRDGDLVLFRQRETAEDGDVVVALINDAATIKEFHRLDGVVVLKPRSNNPVHKVRIMDDDFQVQGVMVRSFKNFTAPAQESTRVPAPPVKRASSRRMGL